MTQIHLARAPEEYDYRDQNVMRKTIESALLATVDGTSSNMGDIVVTDPENGQVLIYSDGAWINHSMVLGDLDDVVVPTPSDGEYLGWNGANWVNKEVDASEVYYRSPYIDPDENIEEVFGFHASAGHHTGGFCSVGTTPGDVDVAAGTGWLRPVYDDPVLYGVEWAAETISITAGEFTSIGIGWVGGVPRVIWKYGNAYWNNQDEFQIGNALWEGGSSDAFVFQQYSYIPNASGKIATRFLEAFDQGRAFRQGLVFSDKEYLGTYRYVAMTAGVLWDVFQRTEVEAFDSSGETVPADAFFVLKYDLSIPGFTLEGPYTQWDNTQWNDHTDGATPLKAIPTDKWAVFWWTLTSDGVPVAVYPDAYHDDQASAEDAPPPDHLTDEIESQIHSKFVFQEGELNAKEVFTLWGDVGGIEPGQAPNDHGALLGLADDDHSQYLHIAVSRQVTAQHNFTVYGTGDFLNDEWDILFGDTTVNKWGAILVGGAAFALGGSSMSSVGSPGIDLEGTVIISNRGNGPSGNSEYVFGDSIDEIRFGLPKSGAGLGTYNPRSMIIAGPAEFDDNIYLGSHWGFDNLPMDTGTYGADLGVQHDVEVLGKIWVDTIGTSTTDGTLTFDDDVIFTESVTFQQSMTLSGGDNIYFEIEATDVDSMAWLALKNDAREYRLRVTGANEFDIYDVTAATSRITIATDGVMTTGAAIAIGGALRKDDNTSGLYISAGDSTTTGANLRMFGPSHASTPYDFIFRNDTTNILRWDESDGQWESDYPFVIGALTVYHATSNNVALFESGDAYVRINFRDGGGSSDTHVGIGAQNDSMIFRAGNSDVMRLSDSNVLRPLSSGLLNFGSTSYPWGAAYMGALSATTGTFSGRIYAEDDIVMSTGQAILASTSDGSDVDATAMCGGGSLSTSRGGYVITYGNEHANAGQVTIRPGSTASGPNEILLDGTVTTGVLTGSSVYLSGVLQFTDTDDQLRFTDGDNIYWMRKSSEEWAFAVYNATDAAWCFTVDDSGGADFWGGDVKMGSIYVDEELHFGNVTDAAQFHYMYGNPTGQSYLRFNDGATWGDMRLDHLNSSIQFRIASSVIVGIYADYVDLRQAVTIPLESQNASGTLALRYSSDNDTGLFRPGSNIFGIAAGGVEGLRVDNTTVAGNTRLLLYDVDNGYVGRVTVGAANSGGSGYKLLRLPN